jgi:hypothetical protein
MRQKLSHVLVIVLYVILALLCVLSSGGKGSTGDFIAELSILVVIPVIYLIGARFFTKTGRVGMARKVWLWPLGAILFFIAFLCSAFFSRVVVGVIRYHEWDGWEFVPDWISSVCIAGSLLASAAMVWLLIRKVE